MPVAVPTTISFSGSALEAMCIFGAGPIDVFVSAFNRHRKRQHNELCFRELMHGEIFIMTAVRPA